MSDKTKIIINNGDEVELDTSDQTARATERDQEDRDYVPVILKRTDEVSRHPDDVLEKAIHEGVEQQKRSSMSLLLSAIAAGLIIGFVGMSVALVSQIMMSNYDDLVIRLASSLVYPLGFIITIMSGTQLFTEHTATAVYPFLDKKINFKSLIQLWMVILSGNLIGTLISSFLIYSSDSVIGSSGGYVYIAEHLLQYGALDVFLSAILAGWLMAQGGWLVMANPPGIAQILCIYIVTFIIGLGGLHHSIAGSAEIFSGLFHSETPNYFGSLKFLVNAIVGNLVGGVIFVGVLNYAHIKKTQ